MAWVAVNKYGNEIICENKPKRRYWWWVDIKEGFEDTIDFEIYLPKGSIYRLIGRTLTWEDDPVELK